MFLGGGACADPVRDLRAPTNRSVGCASLGRRKSRGKRPTDRSVWTGAARHD